MLFSKQKLFLCANLCSTVVATLLFSLPPPLSSCSSMCLRRQVLSDYVSESDRLMGSVAFGGSSCPSGWYRNSRGVNWTLYPKDLVSFWWETRAADWQDYVFQ